MKLKSSFEKEIVNYYDTFFLGDDKVKNEIRYIQSMFHSYANGLDLKQKLKLIDIGCGTWFHDEMFSDIYAKVVGIDVSSDMISYAMKNHKKENIEYVCGNICDDIQSKSIIEAANRTSSNLRSMGGGAKHINKFDKAVSLSHVIGYQLCNNDLEQYLTNICKVLRKGGAFLFNFYNLSAIYINQLNSRNLVKKLDNIEIRRFSNAEINASKNCLDLEYFYIITNSEINRTETYEIKESIRFYSMLELEYYLKNNGFSDINFFKYGGDKQLCDKDWNGGCLARKR